MSGRDSQCSRFVTVSYLRVLHHDNCLTKTVITFCTSRRKKTEYISPNVVHTPMLENRQNFKPKRDILKLMQTQLNCGTVVLAANLFVFGLHPF